MVKTSPFNAGSMGSIPGQRAKVPHALWPKNQNIKQKQCCNKINKDFKNGPHRKKNLKKKTDRKSHGDILLSGWGAMVRDSNLSAFPGFNNCREGNGNPFQYSCLENPVDRGAWWAAVHRVAQSWTRLK